MTCEADADEHNFLLGPSESAKGPDIFFLKNIQIIPGLEQVADEFINLFSCYKVNIPGII